jgi:nucleoid-associated protein YgaU
MSSRCEPAAVHTRAAIPRLLYILLFFASLVTVFTLGCGSRESKSERAKKGALYHYRLAASKYREGDFESAINLYEKALQVDPELADAHLDIGIICDDYLNDNERAVSHYREFLKLKPDSGKAKMIKRWIAKAEEEEAAPSEKQKAVTPQAEEGAAQAIGAAHVDLERAREDIENLKVENEAYLKTISALREELSELRQRVNDLLGEEEKVAKVERSPGEGHEKLVLLARTLEKEKSRIQERYREEKGSLEKKLKLMGGEIEALKREKTASEAALKKTNAKLSGLMEQPPTKNEEGASVIALRQRLALSNDQLTEMERKIRIYAKDNAVLESRLKKTELALQQQQAQAREVEVPRETERKERETAVARHVMAKAKVDAEREMEKLRQSYEKKIVEMDASLKKEKDEAAKQLAELDRKNLALQKQLEADRAAMAKSEQAHADALRRVEQKYRTENAEIERRYGREREILMSKLSEARMLKRSSSSAASGTRASIPKAEEPSRVRTAKTTTRKTTRAISGQTEKQAVGARVVTRPQVKRAGRSRRSYRVVAGDTLTSIATRFYGSPDYWKVIYRANRKTLSAPNSLRLGQVLVIP